MTALFSQIWHAGLTAGFVVLAVLLLRLCFHKAPKWISVVLWGLVAVRLLVPVTLTSPVSVVPSLPESVVFEAPAQPMPEDVIESAVETVPSETVDEPPVTIPATPHVTVSLETAAAVVWVGGIVAMVTYAVVTTAKLRHRVRTATKLKGRIFESDAVTSPFILGIFNPKVYLPYGLDDALKDSVMAHETAHIKRCDHLIKPLGFLLLSVYWFQPLLWVAYILLCRDIEAACDEKAIRKLDDAARKTYSYALVTLGVKDRRRIAACPLAFGEVGVKERVKRVMSYKKPTVWILAAALVLSSVAAVCLLTDRTPRSGGATLEGATLHLRSQELNTKYKRSRSNDVPAVKGRRSAVRDHSDEAFWLQIIRVNEYDMSVTVEVCRDVLVNGRETDRIRVACDEDVTMQSLDGGAEYTLSLNVEKSENPATEIDTMLSYVPGRKTEYVNATMTLTLMEDNYFVWKIDNVMHGGTYELTDKTLTLIEDGHLSVTVFDIDQSDGALRYNKFRSYRHKRASFPKTEQGTALAFCYTREIDEKDNDLYECCIKQFDGTDIYSVSSKGSPPAVLWVGDGYVSVRLTGKVEDNMYRAEQTFIHIPTGKPSENYSQVLYAADNVVAGTWEEDGKCGIYVAQATFCGTPPLPEKHEFVLDNLTSLTKGLVEAYADERDLIVTYKDDDGRSRIVAYDWKTKTPLERAVIPTAMHTRLDAFVSTDVRVFRDNFDEIPYNTLTDVYTDDGRTLHFVGVQKAAVYLDGEYTDLRTALQRKRITLGDLVGMLEADATAGRTSAEERNNDDGTVTYRYGVNEYNSVTVNDTLDGDRDIYMGPMTEDIQYGSSHVEEK